MTDHIQKVREAIGLFASAIKSGEPWTPTCEAALVAAKAQLDAIERASTESVVELEAGAKALAKSSGITDWFKDDAIESFKPDARACAEAWGLKWKS